MHDPEMVHKRSAPPPWMTPVSTEVAEYAIEQRCPGARIIVSTCGVARGDVLAPLPFEFECFCPEADGLGLSALSGEPLVRSAGAQRPLRLG
jgi:hypothetical protein